MLLSMSMVELPPAWLGSGWSIPTIDPTGAPACCVGGRQPCRRRTAAPRVASGPPRVLDQATHPLERCPAPARQPRRRVDELAALLLELPRPEQVFVERD